MRKTYTGNEGNRDGNQELLYGISIRNGIKQQEITVANVPTLIPTTAQTNRLVLIIQNIGTLPVYIGDGTVATTNGFPLYPRAVLKIDIEDDVDIYGIVSAGTNAVRILEGY